MNDADESDEKKKETLGESTMKFLGSFRGLMLTIPISIFTIGVIGLYMTKIAQSNILPTNTHFKPFTDKLDSVTENPIYYNLFTVKDKGLYGQEMLFSQKDFLNSFTKSSFIQKLKKWSDDTKITPNISNYASSIVNDIVATNCYLLDAVFLFLGACIPASMGQWSELFVMVVYGLLWYVFVLGLYFANMGMCIIFSITNLFTSLFVDSQGNQIKSDSQSIGEFLYKCCRYFAIIAIWVFFCLFSYFGSLFFTFYALLLPLTIHYTMPGDNGDKPYSEQPGILRFIADTFAYKKYYFIFLTLFSLIWSMMSVWGGIGVVGIIIGLVALFIIGYKMDSQTMADIPSNASFTTIDPNYIAHAMSRASDVEPILKGGANRKKYKTNKRKNN